jgi:hypothetical protein
MRHHFSPKPAQSAVLARTCVTRAVTPQLHTPAPCIGIAHSAPRPKPSAIPRNDAAKFGNSRRGIISERRWIISYSPHDSKRPIHLHRCRPTHAETSTGGPAVRDPAHRGSFTPHCPPNVSKAVNKSHTRGHKSTVLCTQATVRSIVPKRCSITATATP